MRSASPQKRWQVPQLAQKLRRLLIGTAVAVDDRRGTAVAVPGGMPLWLVPPTTVVILSSGGLGVRGGKGAVGGGSTRTTNRLLHSFTFRIHRSPCMPDEFHF